MTTVKINCMIMFYPSFCHDRRLKIRQYPWVSVSGVIDKKPVRGVNLIAVENKTWPAAYLLNSSKIVARF